MATAICALMLLALVALSLGFSLSVAGPDLVGWRASIARPASFMYANHKFYIFLKWAGEQASTPVLPYLRRHARCAPFSSLYHPPALSSNP